MSELDDAYRIAVEGTIEKAARETGLRAFAGVVQATPVGNPDTWQSKPPPGYVGGHARRNWFVDIGTANEREEAGEDPSGNQTIAQGNNEIGRWKLSDVRFVLHNSVPYIKRLNDGWSDQAPAGFVEHNADRAARITSRKYG